MSTFKLHLLPVALLLFNAAAHEAIEDAHPDAHIVAAIMQQIERPGPLPRSGRATRVIPRGDGGWTVELDARFLDGMDGAQIPAELDARLQAIRLALLLQREQAGQTLPPLEFRFNGQRLEDRYPEPRPAGQHRDGAAVREALDVFLSAGHGWYLRDGRAWRLQRPLVNGMVEDLVTPQFARKLAASLHGGGVTTAGARSEKDQLFPAATKPWWQMASRYHAKALYPARPDIWQSYTDRQSPLREYNDDIRTRPLLANMLGAATLIHLHTNAAGPAARGAMAFHQPGRPTDRRLGHVLLCAMRASVQAAPGYAGYRVRVQPHEGNYGENRLAGAPSILIEIGFHTNASDAAALQDPVFQQAVAAGLEQGYRNFHAGHGQDGRPVCF